MFVSHILKSNVGANFVQKLLIFCHQFYHRYYFKMVFTSIFIKYKMVPRHISTVLFSLTGGLPIQTENQPGTFGIQTPENSAEVFTSSIFGQYFCGHNFLLLNKNKRELGGCKQKQTPIFSMSDFEQMFPDIFVSSHINPPVVEVYI